MGNLKMEVFERNFHQAKDMKEKQGIPWRHKQILWRYVLPGQQKENEYPAG
jgi:hypothetical protein